ncbi:MAG: hypothetical protein M1830_006237, partial [Pleopsidium flavum]
ANIHSSMNPAVLHRQTWPPSSETHAENMDFIQQIELPNMYQGIPGDFNRQLVAMTTMNPMVTVPEWNEEDFSSFLNPTTMV